MTFVKGDPRINREGRPEGTRNFTTKVREALEKIAEGHDYTYEEAFIKAILKKAIVEQDAQIIRLIWNYMDGLPLQRIAGEDGGALKVNVINYNGDNNSAQLDSRDASTGSPEEPLKT